jgi:predicted glycosyltransferase
MTSSIVFLSRGHGYGHAARDLLIIEAIRGSFRDVEVRVASSGTGLEYYSSRSVPCDDLGISDDQDLTIDAAGRVLRFLTRVRRPDLVVADEVFSAPTICKGLRLRNLLLTDFFWSETGSPSHDTVFDDAGGIVVLDSEDLHRVPAGLQRPVHFTGPLAKEFPMRRSEARESLGIMPSEIAMTVTFGSMHPGKLAEVQVHLQTLLEAWEKNAGSTDKLFVLAPTPEFAGTTFASQKNTVRWVGVSNEPELFYSAADLVFAQAGLATLCELARNRISTVCVLGPRESPVLRRSATFLERRGLVKTAELGTQASRLWKLGQSAMRGRPKGASNQNDVRWAVPERVAELIMSYVPGGN